MCYHHLTGLKNQLVYVLTIKLKKKNEFLSFYISIGNSILHTFLIIITRVIPLYYLHCLD